MIECLPDGVIHIRNINLWAHVGVLEEERLRGQNFILNLSLWIDLQKSAENDELAHTIDYSIAIRDIQKLSLDINCLTIENFSEQIFNHLESLYGCIPMKLNLRKCSPPVSGFTGFVEVQRRRNWPSSTPL